MSKKKHKGQETRKYARVSPAVNVTIYDMGGKALTDAIVTKILNAVHEATEDERLAISYTRQ